MIRVESGGNPLAIYVGIRQPAGAAAGAGGDRRGSSADGRKLHPARLPGVDLGLMQVNSRNLVALGTTVELRAGSLHECPGWHGDPDG